MILILKSGLNFKQSYHDFQELDFLFEARNSVKCLDNFRRLSPRTAHSIYAPKVYWNLSTTRLLTMEFMDAAEITDVTAIRSLGLEPVDVSKLVSLFKLSIISHCQKSECYV